MAQENVETVQKVFEAVARRDTATVLSLYDPNVEWDHTHGPIRELMGGPTIYHGHDGIRRWSREWYDAWEQVEADVVELIDAGESVISVVDYRGIGRGSGIKVELHLAGVWTIRRGKVIRAAWFATRDEALEAAGLSE
jgi:ketosteroid isomerase-like protein